MPQIKLPVDDFKGASMQVVSPSKAYEITADDTDNDSPNLVGEFTSNNINVMNLSDSTGVWVKVGGDTLTVGTPSSPREYETYIPKSSNVSIGLNDGAGSYHKYCKLKTVTGTAAVIISERI